MAKVLKRKLCCIAGGKKVIDIDKLDEDHAWFWGLVEATGLKSLVKTNFSVLDYGLIWGFAERWHAETSTFHLPIDAREEGADMVSTYLGVSPGTMMKIFGELGGPYLKHKFVAAVFIDNWDYADKAIVEKRPMHEIRLFGERVIRAFLLFLVGCTKFSNKTNYYVEVVYLQFFQDLSTVHQWNWGAAALAHLENYLDHASLAKTNQMAGYMSFIHGWIVIHFSRLSVWGIDEKYEDHMGWNAYFVPSQGWLRDGNIRAKHLTERVLRQFKVVQSILRHPSMGVTPGMNLFEIDRVWMEELELRMIDEGMRGLAVVNPWDHEPGYMRWFYRVSHPIMCPVEGAEEPLTRVWQVHQSVVE
ncbi:hypothetical protein QL285_026766 [Trifolium repens]|nr:hypothetical protein QL285_026766 [Trifolium repens]